MLKFLCKFFDHKWKYSKLDLPQFNQDVRVCTRCDRVQYWKHVPFIPDSKWIWMNAVRYTEVGASAHVVGYNK